MQRRHFLVATAIGSAAALTQADAQTPSPPESVQSAIRTFATLPVTASCLVVCEPLGPAWQASHNPDAILFVGSAVKTFILAECLRAVEKGEFTEGDQWAVNDAIRSPSSPVLLNLSGTTPARSVLEAMIAHSDNTATDITLAKLGPDRVRALIKQAGLTQTIIPDSIRRLYSYIAGAPPGEDLGWARILTMRTDTTLPATRSPINNEISMLSTATEMVHWYQQALTGQFFTKPESLIEFKRIQAMADAIPLIVPPGITAYAKGGSIDWNNFHCFCVAGQMIVNVTPITFAFTINWTGPDEGVAAIFKDFGASLAAILKAATVSLRA